MTIKQLVRFIFLWWGQIDGDGLLSDINNFQICYTYTSSADHAAKPYTFTFPVAFTANPVVLHSAAGSVIGSSEFTNAQTCTSFNTVSCTIKAGYQESKRLHIVAMGYLT